MKHKPIALTVDTIIFSKTGSVTKILLIKRKNPPFKDKWAIPGGFVEYDEELETAAKRELEEETGVKDIPVQQLYTFGKIGRDPRGRTVSVVYFAIINDINMNIKAGDYAKEAEWFNITKLPELAFDHREIIDFAVKKCQLLSLFLLRFLALFFIIEFLGLVPVFVSLTSNGSVEYRKRLAKKGVFVATIILFFFAFTGSAVLDLLHISLAAFRIAGGILLLIMSIEMVLAKSETSLRKETKEEYEETKYKDDISVFPLAIPMLSGPAAITVILL